MTWKLNTNLFLLLLLTGLAISCTEEPLAEPEAPATTQKVNKFIEEVMTDVYLWYKEVPDIDTRYEFDSKDYFKKLLYEEDKWSFVTDNVKELEDSFEGIEKSYGWSLAFGRFSNTKTIFALVEFIYPNTPAAASGAKRGDMIVELNGADITDNNYMDLLNSDNISFTFGQYNDGKLLNEKTASMVAKELNLNPVQFTRIIEHEGHKIGYLFYAQFIHNYNTSLDTAFQHFLDNQVTDYVIDLRYNPGGTTLAAQHLCSTVAPVRAVAGKQKLVSFKWNDKYQRYWEQKNILSQLQINFVDTTLIKLGLSKLHILTGPGTASASELTITGLKPYMGVTTVGGTTYGKYTASITFKPEDFYEDKPDYIADFDNWGVQPIILRYANSLGVTDFKDGFSPDIPAEDDLMDGIPLGDKNETLLKAAIKDITGTEIIAMKSARIIPPYELFDRGFSKFDANKRELLYKQFNMETWPEQLK